MEKINTFKKNATSNKLPTLNYETKCFKTDKEKCELFKNILGKTFSQENSNTYDEFFYQKIEKYVSEKEYLKSDPYSSEDKRFPEITIEELKKTLKKLKDDSASGQDRITNRMLKNLPNFFLKILAKFFNLCLSQSEIPDDWKVSKVTMIPKKKISSDPSNYRPISVTSCLGKVLERIITNRLYLFLTKKGFLCKQQSGFRKNRRTADNLVFFTQKVSESLIRGKKVCSLFFDISQAFDKVWHSGIIYKLSKAGAPLYILEWVKNFLRNRKFFVKINNFESASGDIDTGVPQGAVISPLLFSIFINDIPKQEEKNKSYSTLFADDLVTFFIFNKYGNIKDLINSYLKKIELWLSKWRLKMAPEKCSYIIFSGNPSKNQKLSLNLLKKNIPYTDNPIFLGIKFDESLCFNSHIEFIRSRCQDRINIIKILSHRSWKLSIKTLTGIYNALVGSIIDYSFFILNLVSNTNMHKLQVLQNITFKSIHHLPYDTPSNIFFKILAEIKVDTIEARYSELFIRYIKKSLTFRNDLIIDLVRDFVDVFVESSRADQLESSSYKTPLCLVSSELSQWLASL